MATSSTGGATLELEKAGFDNLKANIKKVQKNADMSAMRGLMKFLFNIKTLAQQKLKSDGHIITSRLRNSIYVQTPSQVNANKADNQESYSYREVIGHKPNGDPIFGGTLSGNAEMKGIGLKHNEGAVGTNVVYSASIEYDHDSFLYWGMKHADVDEMGRETAKKLLKGIK